MRTCKKIWLHFDQYIYLGNSDKTFVKNSFPERSKKLKVKLLLIYQSLGMIPTNRSVDNYVRQNQSDGALPQISGIIIFWFEYVFLNKAQENTERTDGLIRFSCNYFQKYELGRTDKNVSLRLL